jgi:hypothetical protein
MRAGQWYSIFARLSRGSRTDIILKGLEGSEFTIAKQRVSCKVSMSLDSEEAGAFDIEKVPAGRKDEQLLVADFNQWDWRVKPQKHGTLHLLLYVTPSLYVDGIGEGLKEFRQPPKIITVTPDYIYEAGAFLKRNWTIVSGLLGAVFIPLFLWFRGEIIAWFGKRSKKRHFGF